MLTVTAQSIILSLSSLFLAHLLLRLRRVIRDVGYLSGPFLLYDPLTAPGVLLSRAVQQIPFLHAGRTWALFAWKHEVFAAAGQDAVALTYAFPAPNCLIQVADAAAIKEMTSSHFRFHKPMHRYDTGPAKIFGANIIVSEGEDWKKYRKIVAPAFSEKNNKLVWDETTRIMMDLFDNVWGDRSEIVVDHFVDVTLPIALLVISSAGFGRRVTWGSDLIVPPGHQMTFKDALKFFLANLLLKSALPEWTKYLMKLTRKVDLAYREIKQYMFEMVEERRNGNKGEGRHDLFSCLLDATLDESNSDALLSDEELVGNIFILLLAGHETTAHTLSLSFALLALYPKEQERLYQHVKDIMSSVNGMPTYRHMSRFTQSLTVFYETLRLFPTLPVIPKMSTQDTTLTVGTVGGKKTTFPIPSGTEISIHVTGLHYNPRYWKEPHKFMPERFLGDWPKDAFLPFSQGVRGCLGQRFAEIEAVVVITMLVLRYKVEIKEEPEFAGETFEERYARITACDHLLTTTPLRVPLVFKRR